MGAHLLLIAWCVLAPSIVSAQSSTADGVQAIVRGDYAAAVRILTPLAEDFGKPDPLAQFFLATIYDSGRGRTALRRSASRPTSVCASCQRTRGRSIFRAGHLVSTCNCTSINAPSVSPPCVRMSGDRNSGRLKRGTRRAAPSRFSCRSPPLVAAQLARIAPPFSWSVQNSSAAPANVSARPCRLHSPLLWDG
jgi:hypothetical protein